MRVYGELSSLLALLLIGAGCGGSVQTQEVASVRQTRRIILKWPQTKEASDGSLEAQTEWFDFSLGKTFAGDAYLDSTFEATEGDITAERSGGSLMSPAGAKSQQTPSSSSFYVRGTLLKCGAGDTSVSQISLPAPSEFTHAQSGQVNVPVGEVHLVVCYDLAGVGKFKLVGVDSEKGQVEIEWAYAAFDPKGDKHLSQNWEAWMCDPQVISSMTQTTREMMGYLAGRIEECQLRNKKLTDLIGTQLSRGEVALKLRMVKGQFVDSWNSPLVYKPEANRYVIYSVGPDKKDGTGDDLREEGSFHEQPK